MRQAFNSEHFEIDRLEKLVIISDREKGLTNAVSEVLPNAKHSHCCQHIAANVQSRFGITCRKLFWSAAYARTRAEFNTAIDAMLKESRPAATYLCSSPAKTWATYAFPLPGYGHITSNIVESLNGTLQIVDDDGKDWIVDLERRTCTCLMFQEHGVPCPHAIIAARVRRVDPYTLFSDVFTLWTYRYTYRASIHPVIVRDLEPGPGCLPSLISKKRGRPKTIRIRQCWKKEDAVLKFVV
jgi:hypothetical protein